MISIVNSFTTTQTMSGMMDYSIIAVIFLLLFFSLRNIFGADAESNQHKVRILVRNLNIVSIPLLIVFTTILIYRINAFR